MSTTANQDPAPHDEKVLAFPESAPPTTDAPPDGEAAAADTAAGEAQPTEAAADAPASTPASEKLQDLGITREGVEAMGRAMVQQAQDAPGVEEVERRESGVAERWPADRPLPFRGMGAGGRFDAIAAFDRLQELRAQVEYCEADHEADVKRAKASKTRLEEAQDAFFAAFDSFHEQKEKAARQPDLFVAAAEQDEAMRTSACQIERETGAPCPACQSQRAKGTPADVGDPLHPDHAQHADVAKALLVKDRDELIAKLRKKKFHIDPDEFAHLSVADTQVLQRYAAQRGAVPPPLLAKAHLAAEAGTDRQECRRCGLVLMNQADLDAGQAFYPTRVAVGLDCPGNAADDDPPAPTPESARKPKSHAKKDKTRKAEPEQERVAQTKAGKATAAKAAAAKRPKSGRNTKKR